MLKYDKFLKDLIINRKELEKAFRILLNEQCLATILQGIPAKVRDPGSLTIPCEFGNPTQMNAFVDSGVNIN